MIHNPGTSVKFLGGPGDNPVKLTKVEKEAIDLAMQGDDKKLKELLKDPENAAFLHAALQFEIEKAEDAQKTKDLLAMIDKVKDVASSIGGAALGAYSALQKALSDAKKSGEKKLEKQNSPPPLTVPGGMDTTMMMYLLGGVAILYLLLKKK